MGTIFQDLKYGLRMLVKNPGFTAVAVLTLALGIGANTAIFSVIDGVFLRSLAVEHPDQLVRMDTMRQGQSVSPSYAGYLDLCRQNTSFTGVIASAGHLALLNIAGKTRIVGLRLVSDNYFSVLGINAAVGRTFVAGEDWGSYRDPPVVINYGLWQARFAGDPKIVGSTIVLNGRHLTVLGVAPQWFGGLERGMLAGEEVWLPVSAWINKGDLESRAYREGFELLGRLRPGVSMEKVRTELDTIARRLSDAFPATDNGITFVAKAEAERLTSEETLAPTLLGLGGVGLVLLICCSNVSGMMLARAEARRRQMAVRLALGARRGRPLRQLLTESLLLALPGAGLGLLLTFWILRLPPALMPPIVAPSLVRFDFRVDVRVLAYTLVISLLATVISGLAPALHASGTDLLSILRAEEGTTVHARSWLSARNLLVAGQVALSLTLLIVAGLFMKRLVLSQRINPGFDTSKKLLIVALSSSARPQEFFLPAVERIRSLPGVKRASYAMRMLLSEFGGGASCAVSIPGVEPPPGQKSFVIKFNTVGQDYFQTVGTRILRGREFDSREEALTNRSVLISNSMARRFWPNTDPIGRSIVVEGSEYQIIGLVQDGRIADIHEALEPYIYFPFAQKRTGDAAIIVETSGDPRQLVAAVKREIRAVDKNVIFISVHTLRDLMAWALWFDRIFFFFAGVLGCLGMFLTGVGLYAVVAYLAGRRTHEIGIRMALGARRQDVLALVLKQGLRPALTGIVVGIAAAAAVARQLSSMLYGIAPTDPAVFLGGSVLVLAIALLASYIPARRATKVDPMEALRYERIVNA
jgi:putative ABC transport system permease protein